MAFEAASTDSEYNECTLHVDLVLETVEILLVRQASKGGVEVV
jgi:hypothetical protein